MIQENDCREVVSRKVLQTTNANFVCPKTDFCFNSSPTHFWGDLLHFTLIG